MHSKPLVVLFAAFPSRKDTIKVLDTIEGRGYSAMGLGVSQALPPETAKVAILPRGLTTADEKKIGSKAADRGLQVFTLPIEESRGVWDRHLPRLEETPPVETPEPPPPPSIKRKVEQGKLDGFLHAVKSGLEVGTWNGSHFEEPGWGAVLVLGQQGALWSGAADPLEIEAYVERLVSTADKLPTWFREWWSTYRTKLNPPTPPPPADKESPDDLGPVDVDAPKVSATEMTAEELLLLYNEAEAQAGELHRSLVAAEQTVLRQAQELETLHAKNRAQVTRGIELSREVLRVRNWNQSLRESVDQTAVFLAERRKEAERAGARIAELEAELAALKAKPAAPEVPAGGRLLTADDIASARLALKGSLFTPAELLKKLLDL